jgi:DNA-binding MarR family transcriptional regulator
MDTALFQKLRGGIMARQSDKEAPEHELAVQELAALDPPAYELIELFFFAYRDFVADADRLLESLRFGRAHHRVLHFVLRHPGLTIAELLEILRITKQSLNRVLKELLDKGYVEAHPGVQRQLKLTALGEDLALQLSKLQSRRFARVLQELPDGARAGSVRFLLAMIDPQERARVETLVWPDGRAQDTGER